jgi:arylsulfatase
MSKIPGISPTWLICGVLLCSGCSKSEAPRPVEAVFLIVVDTLRPDRLSCYGSENHSTPHIDRLAQSGVRFTHAQSVASWTVPSMGSMMTSLYPTQLGLVERPGPEGKRFQWREKRRQIKYTLPLNVKTLAEIMGDAGFYPAAFVNQPFINFKDGFLQGFAQWCYTTGEKEIQWHDTGVPIPSIEFPAGTDLGRADRLLVDEFSGWLERNAGKRPFVWLHLLKPHWPYLPARRYMPGYPADPRRIQPSDLYDGEVREIDDMIETVLTAIDAHVGFERSLIVFTSDHGEAFGEHGMHEHGHSLHREIIHVPLIIQSPSLPAGRTVESQVRTIDIPPTILELSTAASHAPAGMEGTSLLPMIRGSGGDLDVFSEGMLYGSTERSLLSGGYKLMFDEQAAGQYALFDISADPLEMNDLVLENELRAAELRTDMSAVLERLAADYLQGRGNEDTPTASQEEDERVLRSLRALGYINQ